ncbi:MAG: DUF5711 family protein [Saccharofermentans sp.]|nr:DUF5711 family protein [Saccharofermentans sp.]
MESDSKKIKNKKNIDKKLVTIIIAFAIVIVISVVLLILVSRKQAALQGADQVIRLSAQGGFTCEYAEAQKLYIYSDGVLKVTTDRIAYLTSSGNEVFSTSVSYNNPRCMIKNERAVVIDVDGYGVTVLDNEKVIYSKPTSGKVKAAYLSDNGMCALVTDAQDAYGQIIIFDADGNQISQWTSYNSGYPISVGFNKDDSSFAVTTVNTSGAVYQPYVRVFNIGEVNGFTTTSDYAIYTIDEPDVFGNVMYLGESLFTFSANKVYMLNNEKLVALDKEFGAIVHVTLVGDKLFIVYADGVDQLNKLAVIDSSATLIYDSEVGSEVNAVAEADGLYALSIDKRIYVFNDSGSVISDISVDEDILRIGFIGNGKLAVVSTGGVHTIDY